MNNFVLMKMANDESKSVNFDWFKYSHVACDALFPYKKILKQQLLAITNISKKWIKALAQHLIAPQCKY